ncbi:MAG: class I SAM-dependent DNA methyltransferase [Akkermansiaceae bacterium]
MYHSLEAKLHDLFWASEGACAELPLIKQFLSDHPGTALELGCGSGRLIIPLLKDGFLIEGLDNATEMLAICEAKALQNDELSPILHHASMEDFQTGCLYNAITIPAFTLQFISAEKLPAILANIKAHLHPGGALYFTTFIPWAEITAELEEGKWYLDHEAKTSAEKGKNNTAKCHTKFKIQRLSQQLTRYHRYKIVSSQGKILEKSESTHELTWFWPRELTMHLETAGFEIQQTIGDFDPEVELDENSQILTVVASLKNCEEK